MAISVFGDKAHLPGDEDLAEALGPAADAWTALLDAVRTRFGPVSASWGFASKSTGWGLRLQLPTRTILYMTPQSGQFLASFALGERAVAAAHEAGLPAGILAAIDAAPRYAEGRGVRLEVRSPDEVAPILRLAEVKMAH